MTHAGSRQRGLTLVEVVVVVALGALVLGLILDALIETNRSTDTLVAEQLMRQEALIIGQTVEKVIRFRVAASELAPEARGGAAPPQAAGGQPPPAVPGSLKDTISTAAIASRDRISTAPATATTPVAPHDAFSSAPPSIRALLTTATVGAAPVGAHDTTAASESPSPAEEFSRSVLRIHSLAFGRQLSGVLCTIGNDTGAGKFSHVIVQRSPAGTTPETSSGRKPIGAHPDRFQSDISFRYANEFSGLDARWTEQAAARPRLVEYTVRVWPASESFARFDQAQDSRGRPVGFKMTSAVRMP